jgi:hypothetical protein
MADEHEDESSRLLKKILSPAEAQSLVLPPPIHAPASGPAESTPLSGNLAKPPAQATPTKQTGPIRTGLSGYFASSGASQSETPDRSGDASYVKVLSRGQVGYLPKANLLIAKQIDANLKVLE